MALLMTSMIAYALPSQAQSTLPANITPTNTQNGGSIPLPSGVTPDVSVDTTAYLSFRPNPVGKGQPVLVNIWLTPALHVARYLTDYKVIITAPDGTVETHTADSYRADATAWFEFTPTQTGQYKLKFEFQADTSQQATTLSQQAHSSVPKQSTLSNHATTNQVQQASKS